MSGTGLGLCSSWNKRKGAHHDMVMSVETMHGINFVNRPTANVHVYINIHAHDMYVWWYTTVK